MKTCNYHIIIDKDKNVSRETSIQNVRSQVCADKGDIIYSGRKYIKSWALGRQIQSFSALSTVLNIIQMAGGLAQGRGYLKSINDYKVLNMSEICSI